MIALALALFVAQAPAGEERRVFPFQARLAAGFGVGTTTLARGELAALATFGTVRGGSGRFFAIGGVGQVEQPDVARCTRTCGRWGAGPMLRYGYAKQSPDGLPEWHAGVELSALYSQQFIAVPLVNLEAFAVRLGFSATALGLSRAATARQPSETNAALYLFTIFNHAGVFAETSRHFPGAYRVHFGVQLGGGI